jgi:predicted DNA-binding transcriptional regulator AlpA
MSSHGKLIVSEAEAASMLCLSKRTLQRLRADGSGPAAVQLTERRLGYRLEDLEAWTQSRGSASRSAEAAQ